MIICWNIPTPHVRGGGNIKLIKRQLNHSTRPLGTNPILRLRWGEELE
jgi:hypothetical protein